MLGTTDGSSKSFMTKCGGDLEAMQTLISRKLRRPKFMRSWRQRHDKSGTETAGHKFHGYRRNIRPGPVARCLLCMGREKRPVAACNSNAQNASWQISRTGHHGFLWR